MRDLQALWELWKKTTSGIYEAQTEKDAVVLGEPQTIPAAVRCISCDEQGRRRIQFVAICESTQADNNANAQFFAEAHNAWPEIIDRAIAAEQKVEELKRMAKDAEAMLYAICRFCKAHGLEPCPHEEGTRNCWTRRLIDRLQSVTS